jgi:quercetin dioxygenase-like cupin family protein
MNTETAVQSSILLRAHDLAVLDVFGTRVTVLGSANETAGAFSLAKVVCPPGTGAPPHTHQETEHFHVLRGQLTVHLGNERIELLPGDTIHIPSGAPHAFAANSLAETGFLSMATPAGHENFFRDADELSKSGRFNPETATELCQKHGIALL